MNLRACACAHNRRFSVQRLSVACVHYHGIATLSSTLPILFFCQNALSIPKKNISAYEQKREGVSVFSLLRERKRYLYICLLRESAGLCMLNSTTLLPLNMGALLRCGRRGNIRRYDKRQRPRCNTILANTRCNDLFGRIRMFERYFWAKR